MSLKSQTKLHVTSRTIWNRNQNMCPDTWTSCDCASGMVAPQRLPSLLAGGDAYIGYLHGRSAYLLVTIDFKLALFAANTDELWLASYRSDQRDRCQVGLVNTGDDSQGARYHRSRVQPVTCKVPAVVERVVMTCEVHACVIIVEDCIMFRGCELYVMVWRGV